MVDEGIEPPTSTVRMALRGVRTVARADADEGASMGAPGDPLASARFRGREVRGRDRTSEFHSGDASVEGGGTSSGPAVTGLVSLPSWALARRGRRRTGAT
ncbi:MAG: hypothetical protein GKS06_03030 [Acidobacteria bacterium]|nr:hypothetical protein [Acidobacteriota bacterium]